MNEHEEPTCQGMVIIPTSIIDFIDGHWFVSNDAARTLTSTRLHASAECRTFQGRNGLRNFPHPATLGEYLQHPDRCSFCCEERT